MPYIRLTTTKHIRRAGIQTTYRPGDWVEVGKQTATLWLADGTAEVPGPDASKMKVVEELLGPKCGVRVLGKVSGSWRGSKQSFGNCIKFLKFSTGLVALPYQCTMLWRPPAKVSPQQVLIGFSQISNQKKGGLPWEMVARLRGALARDTGTKEEQVKTKALIGDLRIPIYDTGVLWIRKTKKTERFVRRWATAIAAREDRAHAFLRVLYEEKILVCTLPVA